MSRRLVVVLFVDLAGWTGLAERVDPEPLQELLERYYEICSSAVDDHGGVVEKFIGDAVMAVFGATTARENDALRALRAAFRIHADVAALRPPGPGSDRLRVHCGAAAGEALVTHSPRAGLRVVGDVVNLAARLQAAAVADEVLVNDVLARLARPYATVVPTAPVSVKGKAEPVAVVRVTAVAEVADATAEAFPMVNRHAETARLRDAGERVRRERRAQLVTVLGPPGIGKTRLVREALGGSGGRVVAGTFPSYGPGAGSAAVGQVVDALVRDSPECHQLVTANQRLAGVIAGVIAGLGDRSRPAGDVPPPAAAEEVSWAVREVFAAAAETTLTVVWDGLEWAGPAFPDLLAALMDRLSRRAVLMVCVTRSLSDVPWLRPLAGDVVELDALTTADSAHLAAAVLSGGDDVELHAVGVVERVCSHGAGNPLYIRLLLEGCSPGELDTSVPPTITALVGALIDRLPPPAQHLLGAAAVIGVTFAAPEVAYLGGVAVTAAALDPLLEQRVIAPTGHTEEYRFVQQLVHEVAYARLKKEWRLDRHRCLAEHGIGEAFHYEAAARLLQELRPDDPGLPELAGLASVALLAEGTTALRNRDGAAAIALLERALELAATGAGAHRAVVAIRLSDSQLLAGHIGRARDAVTAVAGHGDPDPRSCLVQQQLILLRAGSITGEAAVAAVAGLDADTGDELARCRAEQVRMLVHLGGGRFGAAEQAARAALRCAQILRDPYEEDRLHVALCEVRQWSPTPIGEKLAGCAELAVRFASHRVLLVPVLTSRARYLALTGDGDAARAALAEASAVVDELRLATGQILVDQTAAVICRLDGRHAAAEMHFRRAAVALEEAGFARTALSLRVQAVRERIRTDPPTAAVELRELLARRGEMDGSGCLLVLAAGLAAAGTDGEADEVTDALADEVHVLLAGTDDPCLRGEVYLDLARADRARGRADAAAALVKAARNSFVGVGATRPMETLGAGL